MFTRNRNLPANNATLRRRLATLTHLATPLAVLALLAITAWLTLDARSAERSHRAAAESALRDYAAFASWQYSRHVANHLRSHLMMTLSPVRELRLRLGDELPHPRLLAEQVRRCNCGFKTDVLFAFRLDLANASLTPDREVSASVIGGLARHLQRGIDQFVAKWSAERLRSDPERFRDPLRQTTAIAFDTLGAGKYVLAYALVIDESARPRAVYGVAADPVHLRTDYARTVGEETLLPPSLVKSLPNDSLLAIRTSHPVVGTIFETVAPLPSDVPMHTDTTEAWLGGQVTSVAIRPEFASTLLIGGIPRSRLPLQLAMLAIATTLAIVALVQLRRLRELGRLRERFVANVSHELRTPLAHISMLSETLMLGRERSGEERRHFATVVYREAKRLTTLVESVLRFSRGQASATRVTPARREVARDVHEAVESFATLARASEVRIEARIPDDLAMRVDPAAFRQILLNLCDNAVKFGPRGQTVIIDAGAQNGTVTLSVTDEGRGIPERDRRRVFDEYTRLDAAGAPAVAGAGIGLSVVRDLVGAHGGRVWIETPAAGQGTRVSFTVPRAGA